MNAPMKLAALTLAVLLAATAAACGASTPGPTDPVENVGDPVVAPAPPAGGRAIVGDAAVYAKLEASAIPLPVGSVEGSECTGEGTLGHQIAHWEKEMGGEILVQCEGSSCQVNIASRIDEACDPEGEMSEGCEESAVVIQFELDAAGEIDPASLACSFAG
jgi:hypothetical protein